MRIEYLLWKKHFPGGVYEQKTDWICVSREGNCTYSAQLNRHLWHIEDNEFITNYQVDCDKIRVLLFTRTIREYLSEFEGIFNFALRDIERISSF